MNAPRIAVSSVRDLPVIYKSVNKDFYKIPSVWGVMSRAGTARTVYIASVFRLSLVVLHREQSKRLLACAHFLVFICCRASSDITAADTFTGQCHETAARRGSASCDSSEPAD